jgi:hypothetical protein
MSTAACQELRTGTHPAFFCTSEKTLRDVAIFRRYVLPVFL